MSDRPQRRLAAVASADMAGCARLAVTDGEAPPATHGQRRRAVFRPLAPKYEGRIADAAGILRIGPILFKDGDDLPNLPPR